MVRKCSTCGRTESHRWCCIRERLGLAENEIKKAFWDYLENIEKRFYQEHKVVVKFEADLYLDFQVKECSKWMEKSPQEKVSVKVG